VPYNYIQVYWKPASASQELKGLVLQDDVILEQLVTSGLWRQQNLKPGLDFQRDFWRLAVQRPQQFMPCLPTPTPDVDEPAITSQPKKTGYVASYLR